MTSPTKPNRPKPHSWRIGLLVTTIVLGILLVGVGLVEYEAAKRNGRRITQAQVMYMMMGFQKQLPANNRAQHSDVMKTLYETFKDEGIHRVALYDRNELLDGFGTAVEPFSMMRFTRRETPIDVVFISSELVHAKITLPNRFGGGGGRFRNHPRYRNASTRAVLLELTPKEAIRLRERALQIMLLDIVAAIILMCAAVVFWKQSVRQEKLEHQLQKDRQLKSLGQMSAVIGHELKNTIASIKGHAQLLAENLADTPHKQSAEFVANDAIYLQEITSQMLEFARTGELKIEKVYLDDLAEGAITFSNVSTVTYTLETKQATAYVDRRKLQQVITNLINNANEAGSTDIRLHIVNNGELMIEVVDNGPGIDPAQIEKIFDPFFTTRAKGTGLGLALAKRVVESHGGHIDVTSDKKRGTQFTLHIPNRPSTDENTPPLNSGGTP
ncbi:MAG: ATP-binding protein [Deltaproteobacteria bacterium]|nr:ATP-binding protein [Deltaproteobacteria bacterium]MBN2670323.1 ATP-binding protein [Deltaproteobacteria bacterium]